jgi:CRP-like cAMP-binding protein
MVSPPVESENGSPSLFGELTTQSANNLLASLPDPAFDSLRHHLHEVELIEGAALVENGQSLTHVYFPLSGIISLVVNLSDGKSVEVAMVGRDSVFGAAAALDGRISLTNAIVQLRGVALALETGRLRVAAERSVPFRTMLIRHEQAIFAQAQQSAACNTSHGAEARLARWLLQMSELSGVSAFRLSPHFMAQMIGVRREDVSPVIDGLQRAAGVTYKDEVLTIRDLIRLRDTSCECFLAVKRQYERLLHEK